MGECGRNPVLCLFMQQSESVQVYLYTPCRLPYQVLRYYVQIFITIYATLKIQLVTLISAINIARFVVSTGDVGKFSSAVQQIASGYPINRNRLI